MSEHKFSAVYSGILLGLFVLAVATTGIAAHSDGLLKVHFLDVGQGDAIFIEAPDGKQVLVDGGPDGTVLRRLGELMPFYDHSIDAMVISHPHADHISGLLEVLGRYDVGNVVRADTLFDSSIFSALRDAVSAEHAQTTTAVAGTVLELGRGIALTVLYPATVSDNGAAKPHDDNVVLLLEYKNAKILLTGDAEASVERGLIRALGARLGADILKAGHHGSKTSTSEEFLRAVSPQAVVISVGEKNIYRLPSPEILSRIDMLGIPLYRTDIGGTIEVATDGENIRINAIKN